METLNNLDTRASFRSKLNSNFTELSVITLVTVTDAVTLDATAFGKIHIITGTSADYTVVLPTAVGNTGLTIAFKGSATLTKVVTIDANASETIDGLLTRAISTSGSFTLMSNGTSWDIIAEVSSYIPYTPTTVGWSSFTVNSCGYLLQGKQITVHIALSGTSNSTSTTFTLPPNLPAVLGFWVTTKMNNNGTAGTLFLDVASNVSTVPGYTSVGGAAWTASGTKTLLFNITYNIA